MHSLVVRLLYGSIGTLAISVCGVGCGDPLGWREAAGCCITDEESAVCGDVADDWVEALKREIRQRNWDTNDDALYFEKYGATGLVIGGYRGTTVDAGCLAGLIRLEISTEGLYRKYFANGRVEYEVNYVGGKRHGDFIRYHKDGKMQEKGNYKDGERDGKWEYYDKEGNLTDEDYWADGKCVEKCEEGDEFVFLHCESCP